MSGALAFLLAATVVLSAAGIGLSLFSLWRSHSMTMVIGAQHSTTAEEHEASLSNLKGTLADLHSQLRDLQHQSAQGNNAPSPRAGLNLSKRSQALRLHRQGEAPDRIASALEVPLQEVDLLIKVHRIVISNV